MTARNLLKPLLTVGLLVGAPAMAQVAPPTHAEHPLLIIPPVPEQSVLQTPARIDKANCHFPEYPPAAREGRLEGTVVILFLISPKGSVEGAKVQRSSGSAILDAAAVDGLSQCRFTPGLLNGKPATESAWTAFKYVWVLDNKN